MHTRIKRELDGSTTEWASPDGIIWTMVSQTYPGSKQKELEVMWDNFITYLGKLHGSDDPEINLLGSIAKHKAIFIEANRD